MSLSTSRTRRRAALAAGVAALGLVGPTAALAASTSRTYFVGPVDMLASRGLPTNYVGDMPDASVYYENGTYYAYSTSTGGSFVPVWTSKDGMKTWQTNRSYSAPATAPNGVPVRTDAVFNDALLGQARWAQPNPGPAWTATGGSTCTTKNASGQVVQTNACTHAVSPSVVKVTSGPAAGKYLMAYGIWAKTGTSVRMAVTTAIADSPQGPFTDYSTQPVYVGPYGEGSIDPQLFKDPATGKLYLQWMNQGNPAGPDYDSTIYSQEIAVAANGVATKVGAMNPLLSTKGAQPWEANSAGYGTVVEQPSMVAYGGKYYLFYSSQLWTTAKYRMGYAVCNGPTGGCTRASTAYNPLMGASAPFNADGLGGGSAFVDANGRLRAIYQAWAYGKAGYSATDPYAKSTPDRQRFGHVATLDQDGVGNLLVSQRTLAQAPTGCTSPNLFPKNDNWVDMFACQYPALGPKAPAKGTGTQPEYERIGGADRYAVSASTSRRAGFAPGVAEVLVASGANFPDALAAGATSAGRSPVLLVPTSGTLPAVTRAELARLRPGAVTIVGGTPSVSAAMEAQIKAVVPTVRRVAGPDRFAVAAALSARPTGTSLYVANGMGFADALAGGVGAGRASSPLLLTAPTALPAATADAVRRRVAGPGVSRIVILGSTASVSAAVESQLHALAPSATVVRIGGADRYAVAAGVSRDTYPAATGKVMLANGLGFSDALSAVPVAIKNGAPLLLTAPTCQPAVTLAETRRQAPTRTTGVGGPPSVSDTALLHGGC